MESVDQVARNMSSVGLDLNQWVEKGLLVHQAWRPSQYGIEMHLLRDPQNSSIRSSRNM